MRIPGIFDLETPQQRDEWDRRFRAGPSAVTVSPAQRFRQTEQRMQPQMPRPLGPVGMTPRPTGPTGWQPPQMPMTAASPGMAPMLRNITATHVMPPSPVTLNPRPIQEIGQRIMQPPAYLQPAYKGGPQPRPDIVQTRLERWVDDRMKNPGEPHPDPVLRMWAQQLLGQPDIIAKNPNMSEEERLGARDFLNTIVEGAPSSGHESVFPGIMGKIPGLRTPEELAMTIGTAGIGSASAPVKAWALGGGIAGAYGGEKLGPRVMPDVMGTWPDWVPVVGGQPITAEFVGGMAGGLAGGFGGAGVGPPLTRATGRAVSRLPTATRGYAGRVAAAAPGATRATLEPYGLRRPAEPTTAGRKVPPEGVVLTNDVPEAAAIHQTLLELDDRIAAARNKVMELSGKRGVTAARQELADLQVEQAKAQAQAEIRAITDSGRPIDAQFEEIQQAIKEMQDEQMELAGLDLEAEGSRRMIEEGNPAARRARLYNRGITDPDDIDRLTSAGRYQTRQKTGPEAAANRASRREALRQAADVQNARYEIYKEFLDNSKMVPAENVPGTRARFTETGEVIEEPTYAGPENVPAESQAPMFEGQGPGGTMDVETAGPLFRQAEPSTKPVPKGVDRRGQPVDAFEGADTDVPIRVRPARAIRQRPDGTIEVLEDRWVLENESGVRLGKQGTYQEAVAAANRENQRMAPPTLEQEPAKVALPPDEALKRDLEPLVTTRWGTTQNGEYMMVQYKPQDVAAVQQVAESHGMVFKPDPVQKGMGKIGTAEALAPKAEAPAPRTASEPVIGQRVRITKGVHKGKMATITDAPNSKGKWPIQVDGTGKRLGFKEDAFTFDTEPATTASQYTGPVAPEADRLNEIVRLLKAGTSEHGDLMMGRQGWLDKWDEMLAARKALLDNPDVPGGAEALTNTYEFMQRHGRLRQQLLREPTYEQRVAQEEAEIAREAAQAEATGAAPPAKPPEPPAAPPTSEMPEVPGAGAIPDDVVAADSSMVTKAEPDVAAMVNQQFEDLSIPGAGAVPEEAVPPGGAPPREPPPPPPPDDDLGPTGVPGDRYEIGDIGHSGADSVLKYKENTLLRAGKWLTETPLQHLAAIIFPAIKQARKILVSYNARQSVIASLQTQMAAARKNVLDNLLSSWEAHTPKYIGPQGNKYAGQLIDWAANPDFYEAAHPSLRGAATAYDDVSTNILRLMREYYGVDIKPYTSGKPDSFYLPTVPTRESIEDWVQAVSDAYVETSLSGTARRKPRIFEGAYQRSLRDPDFVAETDLLDLTAAHDRGLSHMAGGNTFRRGSGGKTLIDVVDEVHPGFREARAKLTKRVNSLKGRIQTAEKQMKLGEKQAKRIATQMRQTQSRYGPILERIDELGEEWGPELSYLSGQARELEIRLNNLRNMSRTVADRTVGKALNFRELESELTSAVKELDGIRRRASALNLEPYTLSRKTWLYYKNPQDVADIDGILQTKWNRGDSVLNAIDEVRLFAFALDASPLTIQGALGMLANPVAGARALPQIMRTLANPETILTIAQQESAMVRRFILATGRPFGELGPEFVQAHRGLERVPVVGHQLNSRLMSAVEVLRYNLWKSDTQLLQKLGGMSVQQADAEAANALSKIIPAMNPAERGRSVLGARLERAPIVSTSFLGGPIGTTKDLMSGFAKLVASKKLSPKARWQSLAGREQLAVVHATYAMGAISTLSVGSHILWGYSPEEAVKMTMDPKNPRFMGIAFGKDDYIPIGGPFRSFMKGIMPEKVAEIDGVPLYLPFNNMVRFLQGKVTPALGTTMDLYSNRDYFGRKVYTGDFPGNVLQGAWYGANNMLPLFAGNVSERFRLGEDLSPTDIAKEAGGQLGGVDIRQESPFRQLNQIAQEEYGQNFYDLDFDKQMELEKRRDVRDLQGQLRDTQRLYQSEMLARSETRAEAIKPERAILKEINHSYITRWAHEPENPIYQEEIRRGLEEVSDARARMAAKGDAIFIGTEFEAPDPETQPIKTALLEYWEIRPDDAKYRDPITRETDWDLFFEDREAALSGLDEDQRAAADAYLERNLLPIEKARRDARERLDDAPNQWRNMPKEFEEEYREFSQDVVAAAEYVKYKQNLSTIPYSLVAEELATQRGKPLLADTWDFLQSKKNRDGYANPEFDTWLQENRDLALFYPWLFPDSFYERVGERRDIGDEYSGFATPLEPYRGIGAQPYTPGQAADAAADAEYRSQIQEVLR